MSTTAVTNILAMHPQRCKCIADNFAGTASMTVTLGADKNKGKQWKRDSREMENQKVWQHTRKVSKTEIDKASQERLTKDALRRDATKQTSQKAERNVKVENTEAYKQDRQEANK